mmetsp:Transcript_20345/g.18484  ORF Transcript_20345/g.18484 Transcript_20345/m.18484 type:complete len:217 (+) Transcript_20345:30-680(+)
MEKQDRLIVKILVLGCANVGKTSLMQRYCTDKFSEKRVPTVGADFMIKKISIDNVDIILQIWDTAGQERFHQGSLGSSFYRGAHGALLVYDVNNEKSFEQVSQWRDEAISKVGPNVYFPMVVIGNKVDIRDSTPLEHQIDQKSIKQWCGDNSYGHLETSAKDGNGVHAAMTCIAALALEAYRNNIRNGSIKSSTNKVNINKLYEPREKSSCIGCLL